MTGLNRMEQVNREAKVRRYVLAIDEDKRVQGLDAEKNPEHAATVLAELETLTDAHWWTAAQKMRERSHPSPETRRLILNVYRVRAGLPLVEDAPAVVVETVVAEPPKAMHGPSCDCDDCLMAALFDPGARADQLRDERDAEERMRRHRRFGGAR